MIRRVLVVCCGNTCRSPMAAGLLQQMLGKGVEVQSAGLDTAEGLPASKHAVAAMRELGIDISAHRSREIINLDVAGFDVVVAMAPDIADRLRKAGFSANRIKQLDILDPYCQGLDVYRSAAKEIAIQLREFSRGLMGSSE